MRVISRKLMLTYVCQHQLHVTFFGTGRDGTGRDGTCLGPPALSLVPSLGTPPEQRCYNGGGRITNSSMSLSSLRLAETVHWHLNTAPLSNLSLSTGYQGPMLNLISFFHNHIIHCYITKDTISMTHNDDVELT